MRSVLAILAGAAFWAGAAVADITFHFGDPDDPPVKSCIGDNTGDRRVTIDEIVQGVSCAMQTVPTLDFDCFGFVAPVRISDLIQAVNHALTGCGEP